MTGKTEISKSDESLNLKSEIRNLKLDGSNLRFLFSDLRCKDLFNFNF
jgi:hypothetical protein